MPYANCLAKKPTEQVRLSVSQTVLFYHDMPPARQATPRQLQLHLYHHHHRHPRVGCHHYPVDASRFIHVFCYASSLSLSLFLLTKVTSLSLPLFLRSLVIIILHFPARNYTI